MEDETLLLTHCIEAAVNLSNAAVNKMSNEAQRALHAAIAGGAAMKLTIQLTPALVVLGTVEANGQTAQLFEVQFPFQPSELLN